MERGRRGEGRGGKGSIHRQHYHMFTVVAAADLHTTVHTPTLHSTNLVG